ncbi:MAG: globin [Acidimicrobiales bacterium]
MTSQQTVYEAVGGEAFFDGLTERFYAGVAADAELLAMYPTPDDLTDAKKHLAQFLVQYWGGPTTYSDHRGHPRLRMRHLPFTIGVAERDAWLRHMSAAVASAEDLDPEIAKQLMDYFVMAADHLVNA